MVTYDSLIKRVNRLNEELNNREFRRRLTEEQKKQGYSPRCSICTHSKVDEIEKLRDLGYTYEEIIEELDLDVSLMSLSRHFKNHYPNKARYRLKQEKLMLDKVIEAINDYPYLEDYFKDKPYEYIKEFINLKGFCSKTDEAIKYLMLKDDCLKCKNNLIADKLNVLENIIAKEVLGLEDLDENELLYLLYTKYDNDTGAMIDDLEILKTSVKS